MSRIFWDSMILIYLLEDHPVFAQRVYELLRRSYKRNDALFTSCLAIGEVLSGIERSSTTAKSRAAEHTVKEMGFSFLPFDSGSIGPFSRLRSKEKLKIADAIHLACAASARIDLFLTGDKQLLRLDIPGIQFIADFNSPIL